MKIFSARFLSLAVFSILMQACQKDETANLPVVYTSLLTDITATWAIVGGEVASDGGSEILTRGICWGTNKDVTIEDSRTIEVAGLGKFTNKIERLLPKTTYYAKAYAVTRNGTSYGEPMVFTTKEGIIDVDGNGYNIVKIGSQVWMAENLRTTKLNDGSPIKIIKDQYTNWPNTTVPAYAWYDYSIENLHPYGALYNWHTIENGKLCPVGWHVPTMEEWMTLKNELGGSEVAGGKLKEQGTAHWQSPNKDATDEYGFGAVAGGNRTDNYGFQDKGIIARYWASDKRILGGGSEIIYYAEMIYHTGWLQITGINRIKWGFSVRCIKDKE